VPHAEKMGQAIQLLNATLARCTLFQQGKLSCFDVSLFVEAGFSHLTNRQALYLKEKVLWLCR